MTGIAAKQLIIASVLVLTLAGCTDLPFNRPPSQLFVLSPKSSYDTSLPKVSWQLSVDVPVAEAGINTSRIAVRRSPVRLNYFESVNWSDIAPRMVQTLMIESFENRGRTVGVGRQNIAPQRVIVAGQNHEAIVTAEGEGIDNIVNAFDDALGKVLKKVVTWSLQAGEKDQAARR